jgi:hypothetical protein
MYKRENLEHYAALSPYLCHRNTTRELSLGYFCGWFCDAADNSPLQDVSRGSGRTARAFSTGWLVRRYMVRYRPFETSLSSHALSSYYTESETFFLTRRCCLHFKTFTIFNVQGYRNLDTMGSTSEIPGKFLKCCVGKGLRRSIGPIVWEMKKYLHRVRSGEGEGISCVQ